jgi:hypothetical protein
MTEAFQKTWEFIKDIREDFYLTLTFGGVFGAGAYLSREGIISNDYFEYSCIGAVVCIAFAVSGILKTSHNTGRKLGGVVASFFRSWTSSRRDAKAKIVQLEKLDALQQEYPEDYKYLRNAFIEEGYTHKFKYQQSIDDSLFLAEMEREGLLYRRTLKKDPLKYGVQYEIEIIDVVSDLWFASEKLQKKAQKQEMDAFDKVAEAKLHLLSTELKEQAYLLPRLLQIVSGPFEYVDGSDIDTPMHHYLKRLAESGLVWVAMPGAVDARERAYIIRIPDCVRQYAVELAGLTFQSADLSMSEVPTSDR